MTDQPVTESLQGFLRGETDDQSEDSASDVGTRIADARAAAERTQAEVANQLGVKVSTLNKWESGAASPRANRLTALAGILGVSPSWLIVGHGIEPIETDNIDDVRIALSRMSAQLNDTLREIDALAKRLEGAG